MKENQLIGNILAEEMDNHAGGGAVRLASRANGNANSISSHNSGMETMENSVSLQISDKADLSQTIMRSTSAPPVLNEQVRFLHLFFIFVVAKREEKTSYFIEPFLFTGLFVSNGSNS